MGRPKICNPCCGGGNPSSSSISTRTGCAFCIGGVLPSRWTTTVAGFTAGTCANNACEQANGTYVIPYIGGAAGCTWQYNFPGNTIDCNGISRSGSFASVSLANLGTPGSNRLTVQVVIQFVVTAQWRMNFTGELNCLTSHVVGLPNIGSTCSGPSSIIISPL